METETTNNVASASYSQLNDITCTNISGNQLNKRPFEPDENSADEDHCENPIKLNKVKTERNAIGVNRKRFKSWRERTTKYNKIKFPRYINRYLEVTSNLSPISEITLNLLDTNLNTPKEAAAGADFVEDQHDTPVCRRKKLRPKKFTNLLLATNENGKYYKNKFVHPLKYLTCLPDIFFLPESQKRGNLGTYNLVLIFLSKLRLD